METCKKKIKIKRIINNMYTDRKAKILRDHQKLRRAGKQRISKITLNMERGTLKMIEFFLIFF